MKSDSTKIIVASAVIGLVAAVLWLGAPPIPAVLGATAAGLLLYWRRRRPTL